MARPKVFMFDDPYWEPLRSEAQRQGEEKWLRTIDDGQKTVVIEIGAGTTIPSVRHFSQRVIHEFGARLIRITPVLPLVRNSCRCSVNVVQIVALIAWLEHPSFWEDIEMTSLAAYPTYKSTM